MTPPITFNRGMRAVFFTLLSLAFVAATQTKTTNVLIDDFEPKNQRWLDLTMEKMAHVVKRKLPALMKYTRTDVCKSEVIDSFIVGAHSLLMDDSTKPFPNLCPAEIPPTPKKLLPLSIRVAFLLLVHKNAEAVIQLIDALDNDV